LKENLLLLYKDAGYFTSTTPQVQFHELTNAILTFFKSRGTFRDHDHYILAMATDKQKSDEGKQYDMYLGSTPQPFLKGLLLVNGARDCETSRDGCFNPNLFLQPEQPQNQDHIQKNHILKYIAGIPDPITSLYMGSSFLTQSERGAGVRVHALEEDITKISLLTKPTSYVGIDAETNRRRRQDFNRKGIPMSALFFYTLQLFRAQLNGAPTKSTTSASVSSAPVSSDLTSPGGMLMSNVVRSLPGKRRRARSQ
jgi:hypothetical protein